MFGGLLRRGDNGDEERDGPNINLSRYASLWADSGPYSPVSVTTHSALTHAASSACIDTLATSVSALPLDAVRSQGVVRVPVEPAPSLIREPSTLVGQDVWLYQLMQSLLTDGNAFGEITEYAFGIYPATIELVDPEAVQQRRVVNGVPTVTIAGQDRKLYPHGDLWHVPGRFVKAGTPFAESPVQRAKATIGAAIAARDFGSRFFGDGAHPTALVTSEQNLTEDQAKGIKAAVRRALAPGSREPLVMGAGLSWEQIQTDPSDSQFIELMRFTTEESCRFWRVPPSMIYAATSGQSVTYANVSQADLAYLKHSLEGHLVRIEKALTLLLPQTQFARFNRNAFLRSDPQTRAEIQTLRLGNKTTTVNEVRAQEDELPFPGPEYSEPGIPGGAVPAPNQDVQQ
jgi:HK97 family phage portal protein